MATELDRIAIRIDPETKARWVAEAQAAGQTLKVWIERRVNAPTTTAPVPLPLTTAPTPTPSPTPSPPSLPDLCARIKTQRFGFHLWFEHVALCRAYGIDPDDLMGRLNEDVDIEAKDGLLWVGEVAYRTLNNLCKDTSRVDFIKSWVQSKRQEDRELNG